MYFMHTKIFFVEQASFLGLPLYSYVIRETVIYLLDHRDFKQVQCFKIILSIKIEKLATERKSV